MTGQVGQIGHGQADGSQRCVHEGGSGAGDEAGGQLRVQANNELESGRLNGQLVLLLSQLLFELELAAGRSVLCLASAQRQNFFTQAPQSVVALVRLVFVETDLELVDWYEPLEVALVPLRLAAHETVAVEDQVPDALLVAALDELDHVLVLAHLFGHYVAVDLVKDLYLHFLFCFNFLSISK